MNITDCIKDLESLKTFFLEETEDSYPVCLDVAIDTLGKVSRQEPCTDAISRQAAINAAIEAVDDWDGGCNKTREEYIRKALETIPPVTPAEKVGHWIPVSERLPEEEGLYLVYTKEQPYVCPFDGREWRIDEVTAWMPLPEPYKASPTGEVCDDCKAPCVMYEKGMRGCSPTEADEAK